MKTMVAFHTKNGSLRCPTNYEHETIYRFAQARNLDYRAHNLYHIPAPVYEITDTDKTEGDWIADFAKVADVFKDRFGNQPLCFLNLVSEDYLPDDDIENKFLSGRVKAVSWNIVKYGCDLVPSEVSVAYSDGATEQFPITRLYDIYKRPVCFIVNPQNGNVQFWAAEKKEKKEKKGKQKCSS